MEFFCRATLYSASAGSACICTRRFLAVWDIIMMTDSEPPSVTFKTATASDTDLLTTMIQRYFAFDQIPFHPEQIRSGLAVLLGDESLGRVWLVLSGARTAGYVILTFGFDLEFGGRQAGITDLYLEPEYRGKGLGRRTLNHVEEFCRESGVHALELQVERDNVEAFGLYQSFGFKMHDRIPMSKRLDAAA